ncbi:MAG TPA: 23S rRNA (uracil(1939)-C(5))-methyltransferase RlmD [Verrucomicrobiae bacterium]|nr:23S rRNA (uracil(1939)-C(5))-methyltransferase RlmD [Verrucomicrobiae bacterium]
MGRLRHAGARPDAPQHTADIIDLTHEGQGLARVDGKVTFIKGALPGERVRYALRRPGRQADEGELIAVEQAAPERVAPRCAHFGLCGGCSLQHLSADGQIAFKQKQLLDALERIGKVKPEALAPAIRGEAWGYRRRARLSVKHVAKKGGVLVGFRETDSPFVAQLESCVVLDPRVGLKLRALAELVGRLNINTLVPQIEVAAAARVALVLRVMQAPTPADLDALRAFAREHDIDLHLQTGGYDTIKPLDGTAPAPLTFSPDGSDLALEFRPTDFIQVNDSVNRQMVRQAIDWLGVTPGMTVLELFCGLGNFSLPLARAGAQVTAVEGEAGLVERARANASANGLTARFVHSDLFKVDPKADWLAAPYDAVLIDPPRAGAQEVLPAVIAARPARVVYVSCHPGTLARDAATLVAAGWRLARAGVLDMFPHTNHVESMALFERH